MKRPQTTFLAPSFHMFVSVDSVEKITICSSITLQNVKKAQAIRKTYQMLLLLRGVSSEKP